MNAIETATTKITKKNQQKYQEILNIIEDYLPEIKKIYQVNNVEIKSIKEFAKKAYKKTYLNTVNGNFLKHYLLLDTQEIISIPVYAIKTKEKTLFKHIKIPSFRRNIGIIEFSKKDKEKKVIIYAGSIKEKTYY